MMAPAVHGICVNTLGNEDSRLKNEMTPCAMKRHIRGGDGSRIGGLGWVGLGQNSLDPCLGQPNPRVKTHGFLGSFCEEMTRQKLADFQWSKEIRLF